MKEQVTKKITTHQKFTPASSAYDLDLLNIYQTNLTNFMNLVAECKEADLDKCILNSPAINWITYSL